MKRRKIGKEEEVNERNEEAMEMKANLASAFRPDSF